MMALKSDDCCILNGGTGAWAFEPLALQLSAAIGVAISETPRRFNYVLCMDYLPNPFSAQTFVPLDAIERAADKRLLADAFLRAGVPAPETRLIDDFAAVVNFISERSGRRWCLKYPTGCGGNGHRFITASDSEPPKWPKPFIVQEFIEMERPEVYRLYCAGGDIFGWIARRFPADRTPSPWVAHARGARYEPLGSAPAEAIAVAEAAMIASDLHDSFGCVDLLRRPTGEWVALEVGTDGLFNHVDRELGSPQLEAELLTKIAAAFWRKAERVY
jgi:glutathione synthase/RimK-type ligase-like ATP-grasp enzyme